MEILDQYHQVIAVFIARVFLGCLFFFQGFDAVFKIKIRNIPHTYNSTFPNNNMPKFLIIFGSWFTSCSALISGALLILGLFEYCALYVLGLNLIITSIGFGINTAMWDTRFVFPRLMLVVFLLLVPEEVNTFSLTHLIFK